MFCLHLSFYWHIYIFTLGIDCRAVVTSPDACSGKKEDTGGVQRFWSTRPLRVGSSWEQPRATTCTHLNCEFKRHLTRVQLRKRLCGFVCVLTSQIKHHKKTTFSTAGSHVRRNSRNIQQKLSHGLQTEDSCCRRGYDRLIDWIEFYAVSAIRRRVLRRSFTIEEAYSGKPY